MKNKIIRIGLTGGIGSGKSYISELLRKNNIPVFDSDNEAKVLMKKNPYIIESLKNLLGDDIYVDGEINKSLMISFLFSSKDNAEKINSIVHPCVKSEFISWTEKMLHEGYHIVAIESAILFESGFDSIVDKTITVHAPLDIRLSRVIKRDNTTREKVLERINSQMSDEERIKRSDFIIDNNGKRNLEEQLATIFSLLSNKR